MSVQLNRFLDAEKVDEKVDTVTAAMAEMSDESNGSDQIGGEDYEDDLAVIGKPDPFDYVTFNLQGRIHIALLMLPGDGFEPAYYYVAKDIRREIAGQLRTFRVVPYVNHTAGHYGLHLSKLPRDGETFKNNSYGRKLAKLFGESAEWHAARKIRIWADLEARTYKVKMELLDKPMTFTDRPTAELLSEALGPTRMITDRSHRVYQEVLAGDEY